MDSLTCTHVFWIESLRMRCRCKPHLFSASFVDHFAGYYLKHRFDADAYLVRLENDHPGDTAANRSDGIRPFP